MSRFWDGVTSTLLGIVSLVGVGLLIDGGLHPKHHSFSEGALIMLWTTLTIISTVLVAWNKE